MTLSEARRAAIEAAAREWAQRTADGLSLGKVAYGLLEGAYIAGATAEAERAEALVAVLVKLEWSAREVASLVSWAQCPICGALFGPEGHDADCALAAALAPYREEEAPRIGTLDTFFDAVERRRGEAEADGRDLR